MKIRTLLLGSLLGLSALATDDPLQSDPSLDGSDLLPCNGYPQYRDLAVNRFFWLGARVAGSTEIKSSNFASTCRPATQDRSATDMLNDGIRLFEVDLCKSSNSKPSLCYASFDSTLHMAESLHDFLDAVFEFTRITPHQAIIVHFSSKTSLDKLVELKDIISATDTVCKLHTERTVGTDAFEQGKCPFIYTVNPNRPWPSIGEIVDYDPDMAQWEGDGEDVGVRSRIILTHSESIAPDNSASYFSKVFWRSSYQPNQLPKDLQNKLHTLCQSPGPIGIDAYLDTERNECIKSTSSKMYDPGFVEESIFASEHCNFDDIQSDTFFNKITVDFYKEHLSYLIDLQERMLNYNWGKQQGFPKHLPRSDYVKKKTEKPVLQWIRDEL